TTLDELDQGVDSPAHFTVADCVAEFLRDQLSDVGSNTRDNYTRLARTHITPYLGRHLLAQLRVADVLAWLRGRKKHLSSRTLRLVLSLLERAIRYAQVQEMVSRNVAELARLDQRGRLKGDRPGRPSKSMTLDQAVAVLQAAESTRWYAYLVTSIVTGARTEEIRALRWEQTDTAGEVPMVHVWASVREDGETKTRRSKRSLELPDLALKAVNVHRAMQAHERLVAGELWQDHNLVFCTRNGTPLDRHNVLRELRTIMRKAGLNDKEWTARELRHLDNRKGSTGRWTPRCTAASVSGRRDLNPRPLDPQSSALPNCATSRDRRAHNRLRFLPTGTTVSHFRPHSNTKGRVRGAPAAVSSPVGLTDALTKCFELVHKAAVLPADGHVRVGGPGLDGDVG